MISISPLPPAFVVALQSEAAFIGRLRPDFQAGFAGRLNDFFPHDASLGMHRAAVRVVTPTPLWRWASRDWNPSAFGMVLWSPEDPSLQHCVVPQEMDVSAKVYLNGVRRAIPLADQLFLYSGPACVEYRLRRVEEDEIPSRLYQHPLLAERQSIAVRPLPSGYIPATIKQMKLAFFEEPIDFIAYRQQLNQDDVSKMLPDRRMTHLGHLMGGCSEEDFLQHARQHDQGGRLTESMLMYLDFRGLECGKEDVGEWRALRQTEEGRGKLQRIKLSIPLRATPASLYAREAYYASGLIYIGDVLSKPREEVKRLLDDEHARLSDEERAELMPPWEELEYTLEGYGLSWATDLSRWHRPRDYLGKG